MPVTVLAAKPIPVMKTFAAAAASLTITCEPCTPDSTFGNIKTPTLLLDPEPPVPEILTSDVADRIRPKEDGLVTVPGDVA